MASTAGQITGETVRTMDDRYRLTLPTDWLEGAAEPSAGRFVIVKEKWGCLSLWNPDRWKEKVSSGLEIVQQKIASHWLQDRLSDVQQFGRLLSSRFGEANVGDRGRMVIPEGFREYLGVQPGSDVVIVGAIVCLELWQPDEWRSYLRVEMGNFNTLVENLIAKER